MQSIYAAAALILVTIGASAGLASTAAAANANAGTGVTTTQFVVDWSNPNQLRHNAMFGVRIPRPRMPSGGW